MSENQLPGDRQTSQPTVLVSGRARALLHRVPLQLLAERASPGDGAIIVSTREDPAVVARRLCGAVSAFDPSRVAFVDATSKATGTLTRTDELRWHVPSPVSFGHVRSAIDVALDELAARDATRIHFLFDTLTTQFRLADADIVNQHAHDLAMTVGSESGLGLFVMKPSVATGQEFEQVRHLVDAHVAVRRTADGPQVRWTGLVGSSEGWVELAETGISADAVGQTTGLEGQ
jgi:hypothetical protein